MQRDAIVLRRFISEAPIAVLQALSTKRLKLILLPTEKCNLRCTYCYEEFHTGRMKDSVQQSLVLFLKAAIPRLDHLELDWFGGEPLLAPDIVTRISTTASNLCEAYSVHFTGSITTNGTLLDGKLIDALYVAGVRRYQITLDGDETSHNSRRVYANGMGTFDRILNSLVTIRGQSPGNVAVSLRLHFTPSTLENVERLLVRLASVIGDDLRFQCVFHSVDDLGGPGSKAVEKWKNEGEKMAAKQRLSRFATELSLREAGLQGDYVCYAARANSFVIRADGRVNKCTVALESPTNQVGILSPLGELVLDTDKHHRWLSGILRLDHEFSACPSAALHSSRVPAKVIPIQVSAGS